MRTLAGLVVALLIACGGAQHTELAPAGSEKDEGAGELARASLDLRTPDSTDDSAFADRPSRSRDYGYGGDIYGGDPYGGNPYGGTSYANWRAPQWNYATPNRTPRYQVSAGLPGSLEGTVTWSGQLPPKVTTPCGVIDNPTARVTSDKRVRGALVYIEKVRIGRVTPYYSRPITVGGVLAKHGCTLGPAAQIVTPLPASVAINGDSQRSRIRVAPPTGEAKVLDLQEGGLVQAEIKPGVTKIDAEDGKLAAAWVIGLESPYYAITDDNGHYYIDELAPGTYEVTFWQPPIASLAANGTWTYGAPIVVKRSVKVDNRTTTLSVALSGR
ncbi:MAG: hypothetical protein HOV81_26665 [Kofleriaceae bacterium]|nr:hypothetical protein [Kofleriaceae bacterium]